MDDIISHIPPYGDCVVELDIGGTVKPGTQAALVYGTAYDGQLLKLYVPSYTNGTLFNVRPDEFEKTGGAGSGFMPGGVPRNTTSALLFAER